ncbi:retrovirus-related pol polyprotein from transposon TNT 1-94 [Tanacetum coccineum]|uniref:Retrovirus-related pol polyprotein from transposon TNT 1-94 n=1 Tax=Tanacetum coccineum TaxID=301880 RepID=A0ABQ5FYQ2_9ASTR
MFTRSIVIQRRVEDLQLGVESYQKKLNLTRPDTYRSDIKRLPMYSAYPNPRGFIYQNKDKKNKLIRIDELYKFSDGTLNDVRNALDDILKRIEMKYLPQTYRKKVDKDRAGAMIQAIDKQLKNRRIMQSLKKFVEHPSDTIHSEDGNPALANIKQAYGRILKDGGEDLCEDGIVKVKDFNQELGQTYSATHWTYRDDIRIHTVERGLVAQGYNQQEGIDFDETYAPVARLESIRILFAYACAHDFKLFQMDVKSAFLNGFINKEVYVAQPSGFVDFEKPNHVFKLKKALYGLKQAPKAWYDRLKAFLLDHLYTMGLVDNTLFTKKRDSHIIIVQIYVDDIIFGSTCQDLCDDFSKIMHDEFKMSMMVELNFFLGLQIKQLKDGIFFNQSKYIKEMLKKFGLEDSKPIKTPMSSETKLPRDEDEESVDDTKYRGLIGVETIVYTDSDHAGDYINRKSTSGVCTFMGCCLTSWFSKKQTALAISTTEAEYVSAKKACQQALWMKQALVDYDIKLDDIPVLCDNKGAIDLSKNPVLHSRTKHIEI